jgi:hypothetical protein
MKPPVKLRPKLEPDADNVRGAKARDFDADDPKKGLLSILKLSLPVGRKSRIL